MNRNDMEQRERDVQHLELLRTPDDCACLLCEALRGAGLFPPGWLTRSALASRHHRRRGAAATGRTQGHGAGGVMHTVAHTTAQNQRSRAKCARSSSSRSLGPSASEGVPSSRALVPSQSQIGNDHADQKPELCAAARLRLLSFLGAHRTRNRTRPCIREGEAMPLSDRTAMRASGQGRLLPSGLTSRARDRRRVGFAPSHTRARQNGPSRRATSTAPVREAVRMGMEYTRKRRRPRRALRTRTGSLKARRDYIAPVIVYLPGKKPEVRGPGSFRKPKP